jgi:5-methylcytosine-specific restriction endonuclease McrA
MHPNAKAALLEWHVGRPMSDKQRKALLRANIGRKQSEETKEKKRIKLRGRKPPEHTRRAVAAANRRRIWTDEMRAKHWNYKDGRGRKGYPVHWYAISGRIRNRDSGECMYCHHGELPKNKMEHDVHHIDGNKMNNDDINLITLCHKCHGSAHRDLFVSADRFHVILSERYGYIYV